MNDLPQPRLPADFSNPAKNYFMSYAIIRIEKIKSRQGIAQRARHNERTKLTPNADESRRDLNHEYVKEAGRSVLELVDERLKEAGVGKLRADATLCVEVLMTGGPDAAVWQRAPATDQGLGQAADMRGGQWAADVVAFAHAEWGRNLISLVLHQDEKTPHFQAFVVPLTVGGRVPARTDSPEMTPTPERARLSARDLFSPQTLAQLQTDFAGAVAEHGFERGIAGSRAHHRPMRQMYGLLAKSATEVAALVSPAEVAPFMLEKPPRIDLFGSHEKWQKEQGDLVNAEIARQVGAANAKLTTAGQVAVAAAGGNEASGRSRDWVAAEKKRGEQSAGELAASVAALAKVTKELAAVKAEQHRYAVLAAGGVLAPELAAAGFYSREALRYEARPAVNQVLAAASFDSRADFFAQVKAKGYRWEATTGGSVEEGHFYQVKAPHARFTPAELRQDGEKPLFEVVDASIKTRELARQAAEEQAQATRRTQQLTELEIFKSVYRRKAIFPSLRLLVEPHLVDRAVAAFQGIGASVLANGWINSQTNKTEGAKVGDLTAVHVTYSWECCHAVSLLLNKARAAGIEVYEPAGEQLQREQAAGKPREPAQREQPAPARSRDVGIGE